MHDVALQRRIDSGANDYGDEIGSVPALAEAYGELRADLARVARSHMNVNARNRELERRLESANASLAALNRALAPIAEILAGEDDR